MARYSHQSPYTALFADNSHMAAYTVAEHTHAAERTSPSLPLATTHLRTPAADHARSSPYHSPAAFAARTTLPSTTSPRAAVCTPPRWERTMPARRPGCWEGVSIAIRVALVAPVWMIINALCRVFFLGSCWRQRCRRNWMFHLLPPTCTYSLPTQHCSSSSAAELSRLAQRVVVYGDPACAARISAFTGRSIAAAGLSVPLHSYDICAHSYGHRYLRCCNRLRRRGWPGPTCMREDACILHDARGYDALA